MTWILLTSKGTKRSIAPITLSFPFLQPIHTSDLSVLEIAAEELRSGGMRPQEVQISLQQQEEGTIYAQILHFINLIVNFRVPLNAVAPLVANNEQFGGNAVTTPTSEYLSGPAGGSQFHQGNQRVLPNGWPNSNTTNGIHDRRDLPFARLVECFILCFNFSVPFYNYHLKWLKWMGVRTSERGYFHPSVFFIKLLLMHSTNHCSLHAMLRSIVFYVFDDSKY